MTFSLCYTSARPEAIERAVNWWYQRAARPARLEFIIAVDGDKPETLAAARAAASTLSDGGVLRAKIEVVTDLPGNCVKGWNLAAARATGQVIVAISDDFMPPSRWDEALEAAADWSRPVVLKVEDGYNLELCTLAIVSRSRYEKFGFLFYPGYKSMFSDTELTYAAVRDGVLVKSNLLFEHFHPDCKKRARDEVDLAHSSKERYETGEALFRYRWQAHFPLDAGPRVGVTVKKTDLAAYFQVIRDDLCLCEVCERLVEEGVTRFFFHVPDRYWSGEIPDASLRWELDAIFERLGRLQDGLVGVHVRTESVSRHARPGLTRIQVETSVRNAALDWIHNDGVKHVLVVDGDELWRRGLVDRLLATVNHARPTSVFTGLIPVIGLPGYPVEKAMDKAGIYMAEDARFQECRGAFGYRHDLGGYDVYHFTATRRTMQEIVDKSRRSGHADDPNYDFEGWIKNVLPNIGVGMTNAHMYRPQQIWKRVRGWRPGELDEIPKAIHQYLGLQIEEETAPFFNPRLASRWQ